MVPVSQFKVFTLQVFSSISKLFLLFFAARAPSVWAHLISSFNGSLCSWCLARARVDLSSSNLYTCDTYDKTTNCLVILMMIVSYVDRAFKNVDNNLNIKKKKCYSYHEFYIVWHGGRV